MPVRRMLQAMLALALVAAPASAQDHVLAFTIFTGGARFSDMASGGASEVRLEPGALAGFQAELWLGRFGGRLNLGATQRGLVGDTATSFLLSTVDVDLVARLLPPKPRRFFSPYAAVGLGYAQYDLDLDTTLVGGEAYSSNPATLPAGMLGIGADVGGGNLAGRIELYDIVSLRSPLDRPDGSGYGPVQHVVLSLGLSFRMGGSAGPIVPRIPSIRPPRTTPPAGPAEPEEPEASAPPPDTSPPTVQPPETPGPIPPTEKPPTEPETPGPIAPPADSTTTPPPPDTTARPRPPVVPPRPRPPVEPPDTTPRRRPPVLPPRPRPPVERPDTASPPRRRPTQPPDSTPAGPPRGPTMPGGIHTVPPDTTPPTPVDSGPPPVQPPPTPGPKPPPTDTTPPAPPVQPPPTPGPLPPPADTTAAPPDTTTAPPPDTTTAPPPDTTTAPPPDTTTAPPPDTATDGVHGRLFRVRLAAAREGTPVGRRMEALVDTLRAHDVPVWRYTERVRGRESTGYLVAALRNAADANTLGDYAAEEFRLEWEWEHIDKDERIPATQVEASEAFVELLEAGSSPGRNGGKKNGPP